MSNEDTLISKLIEETYTEPVEKEQKNPVVDLRNYFEKRLNEVDFNSISDYLKQNNIGHETLEFLKGNGCYRIILNQTIIDFPSNWSIFNLISDKNLIYVDQSMDQDLLIDIFTEVNGATNNLALIKDNNQVQLVFLPMDNSQDHLTWLKKYYYKKMSHTEDKVSA